MTEPNTPNPIREPSNLAITINVGCMLILLYLMADTVGHAVYHAFPATCRGGTACGNARSATIIATVVVAYCLATFCILSASHFTAAFHRLSRNERLIGLATVMATLGCTLMWYSLVRSFTHSVWPWNIGLLADMILAIGGAFAITAGIAYQSCRGQFHPIRRFRAQRGRHA